MQTFIFKVIKHQTTFYNLNQCMAKNNLLFIRVFFIFLFFLKAPITPDITPVHTQPAELWQI